MATLYCSFCGKAQAEVLLLIAGPRTITICDECVELSARIVSERRAELGLAPNPVGAVICPPPEPLAGVLPAAPPISVGASLRWIGIDEDSAELQEVALADGRTVPVWTFQGMGADGLYMRTYVTMETGESLHESFAPTISTSFEEVLPDDLEARDG